MGERNWPIFRRLMFLSSFMSIGEMKAFFQTSGMIPWSREASLSVVSNLPGMTSGLARVDVFQEIQPAYRVEYWPGSRMIGRTKMWDGDGIFYSENRYKLVILYLCLISSHCHCS